MPLSKQVFVDCDTSDMGDGLHDSQATYARPAAEVKSWRREGVNGIGLAEVIRQVRPTLLIGASGSPSAFTEPIVRDMARHTDRPIIFPLSSPAPLAEATPGDLIAWTEGRALIVTGSVFTPVTHKGITHVIGQANNAMLYPGLGLGAIVSRSRVISIGMLAAAANALSSLVAVRLPGSSLLPHIDDLRSVTVTVAVAVVEADVAGFLPQGADVDGFFVFRADDDGEDVVFVAEADGGGFFFHGDDFKKESKTGKAGTVNLVGGKGA